MLRLSSPHATDNTNQRKTSLSRESPQVLEDKTGVFVNGLSQVPVLGWEAALDVLSQGVLNRTTASTLMNTVSSRSHAVFTITLTQTLRDEADPEGEPQVCCYYCCCIVVGFVCSRAVLRFCF